MRSLSAVIMATFILNAVPVLAQENHEEKLVKIPLVVTTTFGGKPVMSPACLGIKERRYNGDWGNFTKTAQTAPEKALIATIQAMQGKDLEELKAASHTDFLANPKQFEEQAKAFFSQFQIFELDSVNASFSYDDMVVFLIKIKYKGRADFIRFVLRHDAVQNKYGFLTGFSNKDPNDLPGIIARDWFVSPWGPAKTTAFSYCEGHEFTHRFLLGSQADQSASLFVSGTRAADKDDPVSQKAVAALTRMQAGLTSGRFEEYYDGYTDKDKKDYQDWFLKETEPSRKQHVDYFVSLNPVFVFNVYPFVIVYTKRTGFAVDPMNVLYFVQNSDGQLKLQGLSMGSTLDRIFKSKDALKAAGGKEPFEQFQINRLGSGSTDKKAECVQEAQLLKIGMLRSEVDKITWADGGLMGIIKNERRIVPDSPMSSFPNKEYCMVDVDFRPKGISEEAYADPNKLSAWISAHGGNGSPDDVLVKIIKTYKSRQHYN